MRGAGKVFCKQCGREIPADANVCPYCGASIAAVHTETPGAVCPRCGSANILFQREQSASVGVGTNTVVVQSKEKRGCFYWLFIGWWWRPVRFILYGWIKALFSRRRRSGVNVHANKAFNHTVAVCQSCGHSWKVK